MLEFYPQIKWIHVHAAMASGLLFALRGGAVLAGARWPRHWLPRYASYTVDSVLLTAALMLLAVLPGAIFSNGWLSVKLVLVAVYIVLGILAMRRNRKRAHQAMLYAAALAVFACIYGIARMHHPLGWLLFLG